MVGFKRTVLSRYSTAKIETKATSLDMHEAEMLTEV